MLIQKPAPIFLRKNPRETPQLVFQRLHVLDIDEEHIAGFCAFDFEGPSEVMHLCQIDVSHIVGRIIVLNLPARPVDALDLDRLTVFDAAAAGDCVCHAVFLSAQPISGKKS